MEKYEFKKKMARVVTREKQTQTIDRQKEKMLLSKPPPLPRKGTLMQLLQPDVKRQKSTLGQPSGIGQLGLSAPSGLGQPSGLRQLSCRFNQPSHQRCRTSDLKLLRVRSQDIERVEPSLEVLGILAKLQSSEENRMRAGVLDELHETQKRVEAVLRAIGLHNNIPLSAEDYSQIYNSLQESPGYDTKKVKDNEARQNMMLTLVDKYVDLQDIRYNALKELYEWLSNIPNLDEYTVPEQDMLDREDEYDEITAEMKAAMRVADSCIDKIQDMADKLLGMAGLTEGEVTTGSRHEKKQLAKMSKNKFLPKSVMDEATLLFAQENFNTAVSEVRAVLDKSMRLFRSKEAKILLRSAIKQYKVMIKVVNTKFDELKSVDEELIRTRLDMERLMKTNEHWRKTVVSNQGMNDGMFDENLKLKANVAHLNKRNKIIHQRYEQLIDNLDEMRRALDHELSSSSSSDDEQMGRLKYRQARGAHLRSQSMDASGNRKSLVGPSPNSESDASAAKARASSSKKNSGGKKNKRQKKLQDMLMGLLLNANRESGTDLSFESWSTGIVPVDSSPDQAKSESKSAQGKKSRTGRERVNSLTSVKDVSAKGKKKKGERADGSKSPSSQKDSATKVKLSHSAVLNASKADVESGGKKGILGMRRSFSLTTSLAALFDCPTQTEKQLEELMTEIATPTLTTESTCMDDFEDVDTKKLIKTIEAKDTQIAKLKKWLLKMTQVLKQKEMDEKSAASGHTMEKITEDTGKSSPVKSTQGSGKPPSSKTGSHGTTRAASLTATREETVTGHATTTKAASPREAPATTAAPSPAPTSARTSVTRRATTGSQAATPVTPTDSSRLWENSLRSSGKDTFTPRGQSGRVSVAGVRVSLAPTPRAGQSLAPSPRAGQSLAPSPRAGQSLAPSPRAGQSQAPSPTNLSEMPIPLPIDPSQNILGSRAESPASVGYSPPATPSKFTDSYDTQKLSSQIASLKRERNRLNIDLRDKITFIEQQREKIGRLEDEVGHLGFGELMSLAREDPDNRVRSTVVRMTNDFNSEVTRLKNFIKAEQARHEANQRKQAANQVEHSMAMYKHGMSLARAINRFRDDIVAVLQKDEDLAIAASDINNLTALPVEEESPVGLRATSSPQSANNTLSQCLVIKAPMNVQIMLNQVATSAVEFLKGIEMKLSAALLQRRLTAKLHENNLTSQLRELEAKNEDLGKARSDVDVMSTKYKETEQQLMVTDNILRETRQKEADRYGDLSRQYRSLMAEHITVIHTRESEREEYMEIMRQKLTDMNRVAGEKQAMDNALKEQEKMISNMRNKMRLRQMEERKALRISASSVLKNLKILEDAFEKGLIQQAIYEEARTLLEDVLVVLDALLGFVFKCYLQVQNLQLAQEKIAEKIETKEMTVKKRLNLELFKNRIDAKIKELKDFGLAEEIHHLNLHRQELLVRLSAMFSVMISDTGIMLIRPALDVRRYTRESYIQLLAPQARPKAVHEDLHTSSSSGYSTLPPLRRPTYKQPQSVRTSTRHLSPRHQYPHVRYTPSMPEAVVGCNYSTLPAIQSPIDKYWQLPDPSTDHSEELRAQICLPKIVQLDINQQMRGAQRSLAKVYVRRLAKMGTADCIDLGHELRPIHSLLMREAASGEDLLKLAEQKRAQILKKKLEAEQATPTPLKQPPTDGMGERTTVAASVCNFTMQ